MFLGFMKKITKSDPLSKSHKEFMRILDLEEKRKILEEEYGLDYVKTQKEMLRNNFLTLSRFYDSLEKPDFKKNISKNEYFNMQGTYVNIILCYGEEKFLIDIVEKFSHKETGTTTEIKYLDYYETEDLDLVKIERRFNKLDSSKIKKVVLEKINKQLIKKISEKINYFSEKFRGNEELCENFIIDNLKDNSEEKNINSIILRLKFLSNLSKITNDLIRDSNDYNISNKTIIAINIENVKEYEIDILDFLRRLDQKMFDFIIY